MTGEHSARRSTSSGPGCLPRTVILLGASNLTIAWPHLMWLLERHLSEPLNVLVAMGLGRSYVDWSRFAARRLPGIRGSQLFDQLRQMSEPMGHRHSPAICGDAVTAVHPGTTVPGRPDDSGQPPAPLVLVTDIGNDLLYGREPQIITEAVEDSVQRILSLNPASQLIMTALPMESVRTLTPFRFRAARAILFPGSSITLPMILRKAELLDQMVRATADRVGAAVVEPPEAWYGVDPIHIRRRLRRTAFHQIFCHWPDFRPAPSPSPDKTLFRNRQALPVAADREVWGRRRWTGQPSQWSSHVQVFAY